MIFFICGFCTKRLAHFCCRKKLGISRNKPRKTTILTKERFQGYRGKSDMSLKLPFQSFSTERDGQETGGRGVMGVLVFPTYKSRQFPLGFIPNQPFS